MFALCLACCLPLSSARAADEAAAARGYKFLTEKVYLPPDFDQETFDQAWKFWPEPLRSRAAKATPEERRKMAFSRYGLTERPNETGRPQQYVVGKDGNWTMNCFACHAGKVAGKAIPGLPNSHYALATLTEETRAVKFGAGKALGRMDVGSVFVPLGSTNGTTNAVMFGVALMHFRDAELNLRPDRGPPAMTHHDMDPPPWWQYKKKQRMYIDGFAAKGHRALMQFMLVQQNGPEKFKEWEADFRDVKAYIESLEAPKYPFEIDAKLVEAGEKTFNENCARCHGTYGQRETYPNLIVPIEEVGTDRVRLDSLSREHRAGYAKSWFGEFGKQDVVAEPGGYVAPPLDGVWATAPYFHNGSVPTLWHVLRPKERPAVWKRTEDGYDRTRVGLEIETFDKLPSTVTDVKVQREYFDTTKFGKSAAGHPFPDELTDDQKRAVLEYLKTL
jgi:mono/diheme cytochrome c family protein